MQGVAGSRANQGRRATRAVTKPAAETPAPLAAPIRDRAACRARQANPTPVRAERPRVAAARAPERAAMLAVLQLVVALATAGLRIASGSRPSTAPRWRGRASATRARRMNAARAPRCPPSAAAAQRWSTARANSPRSPNGSTKRFKTANAIAVRSAISVVFRPRAPAARPSPQRRARAMCAAAQRLPSISVLSVKRRRRP